MIHLEIAVDNTAELLNSEAYGAGALVRWESSATETGTYVEGGTLALVSGTSLYDVWDAAGTAATFYKTRVSNAGGTVFSAYSAPFGPTSAGSSLTVTQLRQFVTSSLGDAPLQILLDAAAAAIVGVAGATGEVTEYVHSGYYHRITVARLIGTLTSVTEYVGDDATILDATDYRAEGYILTRLPDGTDPRWHWGHRVTVVYTPADDAAERQRVQMELVQLDLDNRPGMASETIGTWTETKATSGKSYAELRADILASLTTGGGMRVVD